VIALLLAAAAAATAQPAPFEVLSVGFDLRIVTVAYEAGPCWEGDPRIGVREGPRAIRLIVVRDRVDGCSAPPAHRRFNVRLRRPLAGRPIHGGPRIAPGAEALEARRAPRVLDMRLEDARRALAVQGVRTRRVGRPRGAVAFQSPLPGKRWPSAAVRLTVGRHLFRARALDRCLERAGIHTIPRSPKPGDSDAPDLVLWLRHPDAMASVGLYRDPVRAREVAPTVRTAVRRAGGVFERRRGVAIAWYAPPDATLRAGARRCVFGPLARPRV
jgi:hypothetical protein